MLYKLQHDDDESQPCVENGGALDRLVARQMRNRKRRQSADAETLMLPCQVVVGQVDLLMNHFDIDRFAGRLTGRGQALHDSTTGAAVGALTWVATPTQPVSKMQMINYIMAHFIGIDWKPHRSKDPQ